MKKVILAICVASSFLACKKELQNKINADEPIEYVGGIDIALMDTTVRPQDDFYNFVNGNWMKNTEIPSDRGRWGSFSELREFTDSVSLLLLKKSITGEHKEGSDEKKVADLYASIMDTVARNEAGIKPIQPLLQEIDSIQTIEDLQDYLIDETKYGNNPLFGFGVGPHMKNSNMNALYLSGPSTGMSRDYYQKKDKESQSKINAYQGFVKKLFSYTSHSNSGEAAAEVVNLESEMANNLLSFEDLRNSDLRYNPIAVADLKTVAPAINFEKLFGKYDVKVDTVIISEINYYKNISNLLVPENLGKIKNYLKATLINDNADVLNSDLEQMNFEFYQKELNGVEEMRAREKRALGYVNGMLGQAFGKSYVKEYFPAEAKERAEEMVRYIRKAFENHINEVKWMTDSTKQKALNKLEKFNVKIGYPNDWKDYSDLEVKSTKDGGSFYKNSRNYSNWAFKEELDKIGKEVDKSEWFMSPQTVNAYYSSSFNEIVFPAAILQPPFYNFKADPAVNFGGMGAVIGHEISHGFDDSGAKYDGDGNLNNWWTKIDETSFSKLGESLAAQYSAYEPLEGIFVNGHSTLGENIADLGGVNVAYDGLKLYLKDNGTPGLLDGFTPEQRFFISWSTVWRTKSKDEALKNQVKTDFHSPGYYRAIGPLENVDSFYEAFNVTENDKMFKPKEERVIIW